MPQREIQISHANTVAEDDRENFIGKYIEPNPKCVCCNIPNLSLSINQAYLDGMTYAQIVEKFADAVFERSGKKLTPAILSKHFTEHFNIKGVAIAEYNRKYGMRDLSTTEQGQMKDVFSALVSKRVSDLELLDAAMREQVKRMRELEDIKKERIEQGRTYNLDNIIMKQEMIMNNLQTQVLSKLKLYQQAKVQSKQMEVMDRQLQFLDPKTASFLGFEDGMPIEPKLAKEAERLYLQVVLQNIAKIMKECLEAVLALEKSEMTQYFQEFNRRASVLEGIVDTEFKEKLKNLKSV